MSELCIYPGCGKPQDHDFHKCLAVGLEKHNHRPQLCCHNFLPEAVASESKGERQKQIAALEAEWIAQARHLDYRNWLQDELLKARADSASQPGQRVWPSGEEIHNRFCGENGELCQVCQLIREDHNEQLKRSSR